MPHLCPKCGGVPKKSSTRYGFRFDCCDLYAWGNYPLVDAETHAARQAAHEAFDPLWKDGGPLGRGEAYRLLADELGLKLSDCHMKLMDRETAERVPAAVQGIWDYL